jgi:NADH-quinone oxidoreductase subunit L
LLTEAQRQAPWYQLLANKYGVDELYDRLFVEPGKRLAMFCWRSLDIRMVDGIVNGAGRFAEWLGHGIGRWQTGYVRHYGLTMLVGVVLIVIGCLIGWTGAR